MSAVDLLFWIFSVLSVGGGLCMIFSRHPVSAAMFMIVSLVAVAALFVLLEAFFLAVLQVLIYAGAVMVLFLFIIMLLDVGPDAAKKKITHWKMGVIGLVATTLLVSVLFFLTNGLDDITLSNEPVWPLINESTPLVGESLPFSTNVSSFGYGLLTKYMLPVQISGFMLLAAMIGVIILCKKPSQPERDS